MRITIKRNVVADGDIGPCREDLVTVGHYEEHLALMHQGLSAELFASDELLNNELLALRKGLRVLETCNRILQILHDRDTLAALQISRLDYQRKTKFGDGIP